MKVARRIWVHVMNQPERNPETDTASPPVAPRPSFPKPVLGESVRLTPTHKLRPPGFFLMLALHRAKQRQLKGRLFCA